MQVGSLVLSSKENWQSHTSKQRQTLATRTYPGGRNGSGTTRISMRTRFLRFASLRVL